MSGPPGVQLLLDPVHPPLPFVLARRQGLHGGESIFEGMELIEDEGLFPSAQDLIAEIPDPCRTVGPARPRRLAAAPVPSGSEVPKRIHAPASPESRETGFRHARPECKIIDTH